MRFMVLIKATRHSEAGEMPSEALLADMGRFNEALMKAGVLLAGEGLHPSSRGSRVRFKGAERTVVDGPFADTPSLIAGFWIWRVKDKAEAIEWVKRCPNPMPGESEIELRQVFEAEDFGPALTPELRAQEDRLRAEVAAGEAPGAVPAVSAVPAVPTVEPVPPASGATPYLVVRGAAEAIGWYQRVFGAQLAFKLDAPDGSVMHAELTVGPARFMLTDERLEQGAQSPLALGGSATMQIIYVEDADAVYAGAVAAGARAGMPMADQFWGDRSGNLTDPFGHQWFISTRREVPSPEEVQRRVQAMYAAQPGGGR